MTALSPPRRSLRRFWPAAAITAIVAVTAGVFVWGGRDGVARARVGQAFDAPFAFDDDIALSSTTLRLPSGGLKIDTTAPQDSAPTGLNIDDRLAPDGGSFVGVWVRSDIDVRLPLPAVTEVTKPEVSVALLVGSHRYSLPARTILEPTQPASRFTWVAVHGRPREVRVAITYDGVTQLVNTRTGSRQTGAAAPLYRLAAATGTQTSAKSCGASTVSDGFRIERGRTIDCEVTIAVALPYLPGRGWAKPGTIWFAAVLGLADNAVFERGSDTYRASFDGPAPVVTAVTPTAPTPVTLRPLTSAIYQSLVTRGLLAVFTVSAGTTPTLTVTATYSDLAGYIENPKRSVAVGPTARVTWTVKP